MGQSKAARQILLLNSQLHSFLYRHGSAHISFATISAFKCQCALDFWVGYGRVISASQTARSRSMILALVNELARALFCTYRDPDGKLKAATTGSSGQNDAMADAFRELSAAQDARGSIHSAAVNRQRAYMKKDSLLADHMETVCQ